jgi:aspartyl-tRNA(Asn)/glutamyl-tRNA(Gln) amidotransferase subunit A
MTELISLTALEMQKMLRSRDISAVELTRAHIERIKQTNEKFNSFLTISEKKALEQAKEADKVLSSEGSNAPALTGIPIAIKDIIVTEGIGNYLCVKNT